MAFGRSFRGITASRHAEKEDIEFQKVGATVGETAAPISAASFGRTPINSDSDDGDDSDDSADADSKLY
jgi:hypothetical protein